LVAEEEEDNGLTAQQEEVIIALLRETTVPNASTATGVSERSIYRWLKQLEFSKEYRARRREAYGQAVALTQRYAPLAVTVLAKIMSDERAPMAVRVNAASSMLKFAREGIEIDDLAARIEVLENPAKHGNIKIDLLPPRLRHQAQLKAEENGSTATTE